MAELALDTRELAVSDVTVNGEGEEPRRMPRHASKLTSDDAAGLLCHTYMGCCVMRAKPRAAAEPGSSWARLTALPCRPTFSNVSMQPPILAWQSHTRRWEAGWPSSCLPASRPGTS